MKKFLLSIAAVMAIAFTASAKDVKDNPNPWDAKYLVDGVYSFPGQWAGSATFLGDENNPYDASANDYAYIKISGFEGEPIRFAVEYNKFLKEESWGKSFEQKIVLMKGDGIYSIELDKKSTADGGKTYAEEIRQLVVQDDGKAGSLKIEEIGFCTKAELDEMTGASDEPQKPAGEEIEVELTEGHTLLISTLEAAGATDETTVTFYIQNNSGESREGWGIGGFAESDNWSPVESWTGMAGDAWTYTYTVADIKKLAAAGEYHDTGITINIYNDCKVAKVTVTAAEEEEPQPTEYIVDDPKCSKLGGWGGSMKVYDEDDVHVIDNPEKAENNWNVQVAYDTEYVYQVGVEYVFEIDIKGSVEGTTFAAGLQNTDGYKGCGEFGNVNVTTEWQHVKLTTTCTGEGAKRLVISVGDYAGKLYVKGAKVYASTTGIANVEVASEEAAFNLFGQKSNGKGFTVKGGKVYLVK